MPWLGKKQSANPTQILVPHNVRRALPTVLRIDRDALDPYLVETD
jgi:hypothetical protein